MSTPDFYLIPDAPTVPYPVDRARVAAAASQFGVIEESGRSSPSLRFSVDDELFVSSLDSRRRYLSVRKVLDTDLDYEQSRRAILIAADNWNRDHYFPTVYVIKTPMNRSRVVGDSTIEIRHGLSDAQLNEFLLIAISSCAEAIDYVSWSTGKLLELK